MCESANSVAHCRAPCIPASIGLRHWWSMSSSSTFEIGVFSTALADDPQKKPDTLRVQTKEGLASSGRDRPLQLDPSKLSYIYSNLPQPVEEEIVRPRWSSAFREVAPNYTVREIFATRRDEMAGRWPRRSRRNWRGRRRGQGVHAARYSASRRVRQGPGRSAVERAGERAAIGGAGSETEDGAQGASSRPTLRRLAR